MPQERSPQVGLFREAAVLHTKNEEPHTYNRQTFQLTNSKFSISCDCFLPTLLTQAIQKNKKRGDPDFQPGESGKNERKGRISEFMKFKRAFHSNELLATPVLA